MKKILVSLVLLLFLIPYLASATNWYVRPSGGSYGNEDGASYENAWDGLGNVVWGSGGVEGEDTLYICGTQLPPTMNKFTTRLGYMPIPGGSPGKHTIIRGDCPGDPGTVWGMYKHNYDTWTDEGDNTYSSTLIGAHYGDWYFEDVTADSWVILDEKTNVQDVRDNAGSVFWDSA